MCRFIGYIGKNILLSDLLFKPYNSLIKQSHAAQESTIVVNADGFGVGWYPGIDESPALYRSRNPAWNDRNLENLSSHLSSHCIMAHVRAASTGEISQINCHPFQYNGLLMCHNGTIHGFSHIKRQLRAQLDDKFYNWIQGQTDSEHFFALFLHNLYKNNVSITEETLASCMQETIMQLEELLATYAPGEIIYLNTIITDSHNLIATRYVSDNNLEARSLHFATGSHYECIDDQHHIHGEEEDHNMILVSSEILSGQQEAWHTVQTNNMVIYRTGKAPELMAL